MEENNIEAMDNGFEIDSKSAGIGAAAVMVIIAAAFGGKKLFNVVKSKLEARKAEKKDNAVVVEAKVIDK